MLGFFGLYCAAESSAAIRDNIHRLLPKLWPYVDEEVRYGIGTRCARFVANNQVPQKDLARQFLQLVGGQAYLPEDLRGAEISRVVGELLTAHRGWNNFYNEPPIARELRQLVTDTGTIPRAVVHEYVLAIVEVYLSNGNGIAHNAASLYEELIALFDARQAAMALTSFMEATVARRLQFPLCQRQFRLLLQQIEVKLVAPEARSLLTAISAYSDAALPQLHLDSRVKKLASSLRNTW